MKVKCYLGGTSNTYATCDRWLMEDVTLDVKEEFIVVSYGWFH
jgi:hypothetical protein